MSDILPKICQKQPFKVTVEAGKKYSWCSCGLSQKQPFCDGAHKAFKNPDGSSIMKSVAFIAQSDGTVAFCGCKHSKNGALCDGSHATIETKVGN